MEFKEFHGWRKEIQRQQKVVARKTTIKEAAKVLGAFAGMILIAYATYVAMCIAIILDQG